MGGVGGDRGLDGLRGRVCLTRKNGRGGERERGEWCGWGGQGGSYSALQRLE